MPTLTGMNVLFVIVFGFFFGFGFHFGERLADWIIRTVGKKSS